jgi:hypothetical protein
MIGACVWPIALRGRADHPVISEIRLVTLTGVTPDPVPVPPQPSPTRLNRGMIVAVVIMAVLLVACIAGAAYNAGRATVPDRASAVPSAQTVTVYVTTPVPVTPSPTAPAAPPTSAPPPAPAGPATSFDDGRYQVGVDIAAGTYKTTVPASSRNCYWARYKDLSGDFDAIIANGNSAPGSKVTVTIRASDKGFESNGCGTWTRSG